MAWLTSWDDIERFKGITETAPTAWKGYDFTALDQLMEKDLIFQKPRKKSLSILPKGEERAIMFVKKLEAHLGE